ncbi:hypothetical protein ABZW82_35800, partial [Streptosporangium sandarakinum]
DAGGVPRPAGGPAERPSGAAEPEDDIHASAAYRRHLTGVLAERALREAAASAVGDAGTRR